MSNNMIEALQGLLREFRPCEECPLKSQAAENQAATVPAVAAANKQSAPCDYCEDLVKSIKSNYCRKCGRELPTE